MKIAIDASRAVNEKAGVGRYTSYLIRSLLKVDKENEYLLLFNFVKDVERKSTEAKSFIGNNAKIKITRYPGALKERLLESPVGLSKRLIGDAGVFLAPTFLDLDWSLRKPQILIIHDLSMFRYPDTLGEKMSLRYQKLTQIACQKATKIIAISESTKKEIIEILNIDPGKIEVIYPGLIGFKDIAKELPLGLKERGYILNVGTVEPRKKSS